MLPIADRKTEGLADSGTTADTAVGIGVKATGAFTQSVLAALVAAATAGDAFGVTALAEFASSSNKGASFCSWMFGCVAEGSELSERLSSTESLLCGDSRLSASMCVLSSFSTVTSNSTSHGSHEAGSEACRRNGGGMPVAAPRGREWAKEAAAVVTRRVTDTVEASLATGEAAKVVGVDGRVMVRCTVGGSADHKAEEHGCAVGGSAVCKAEEHGCTVGAFADQKAKQPVCMVVPSTPASYSCTEMQSSIVHTRQDFECTSLLQEELFGQKTMRYCKLPGASSPCRQVCDGTIG